MVLLGRRFVISRAHTADSVAIADEQIERLFVKKNLAHVLVIDAVFQVRPCSIFRNDPVRSSS